MTRVYRVGVTYHEEGADRGVAPNGLGYRELRCKYCAYHLVNEAILLGVIKKRCPSCKKRNVIEVNRVGEHQEEQEGGDEVT